jgi:transcriptional regulator with GAF, ATPase, and Fis domain
VNVPVLILGETGTGKSLLGRIIHCQSPRQPGPYQVVNCAGVPESLFESEFFGHHRGAFTGARESRRGLLEQAQGGTLFLDEVGELPLSQQAKLLTALEDGEFRRLGGEGVVRVDTRVLAATGRDLPAALGDRTFRRDLYHRLAVLTCYLPPLRERPEDISLLAQSLFRQHRRRHGFKEVRLSKEVIPFLERQLWPGNVRELSHLLEAGLILAGKGSLTSEILKLAMEPGCYETGQVGSPGPSPRRYAFKGDEKEEREIIRKALQQSEGNRSRAARELGMARNTLKNKIRKYGLEGS